EASYRSSCANNLKQMTLAMLALEGDRGYFCPGGMGALGDANVQKPNSPRLTTFAPNPSVAGVNTTVNPPMRVASWQTWILPYIEQAAFFDKMPSTNYTSGTGGWQGWDHVQQPPQFWCASDPRYRDYFSTSTPVTDYAGIAGSGVENPSGNIMGDGVLFFRSKVKIADITDGTAFTAMIAERPMSIDNGRWGWWYSSLSVSNPPGPPWDEDMVVGVAEPHDGGSSLSGEIGQGQCSNSIWANNTTPGLPKYDRPGPPPASYAADPCRCSNCDHFRVWSFHNGGAQWGMCDGSVKFIPWQVTSAGRKVILALGTRNGGEAIDDGTIDAW
ncbi:MAG: DUF1559 domain-containing protein, partial [Gemmataceae bacterium]